MVDTSCSVKDEDLEAVYAELCGAIAQLGGKLRGRLGFFDAAVTPPIPFECVEDLLKIIPVGGGGTDFRVVFDYVEKNYEPNRLPSNIVIFTDGEGPYPPVSKAMGIDVLWIINNYEITPPFGKTVRLEQKYGD